MKYIITIFSFIGVFGTLQTLASELNIFTDVSRASGEVRVYLENIGQINIVVLTKNLTTGKSGDTLTLSPDEHVVILNKRKRTLKEDISNYGAVKLKPGEITYIHRPVIDIEHGTLMYKINKKWAILHEVWGGETKTTF